MRWLRVLGDHFEEGGWGMWPVAACFLVLVYVGVSRLLRVTRSYAEPEALVKAIRVALARTDVEGALACALASRGATARVATAALRESMQSRERVDVAAQNAADAELRPLARASDAIVRTGQIAMLWGLLGTLTGLTQGFSYVAGCDPTTRATALAAGMSEAMNCNAFGLFVAIAALVLHALVSGFAARHAAAIRYVARAVPNAIHEHRARLRWNGARPEQERPTYRVAA